MQFLSANAHLVSPQQTLFVERLYLGNSDILSFMCFRKEQFALTKYSLDHSGTSVTGSIFDKVSDFQPGAFNL